MGGKEGKEKNIMGIEPEKNKFPIDKYRLRRAERREYVATVSSEVGET